MDTNELAERAVLARLFQTYPSSFVWIGGSVLHLLHRSSRASFDIDLAPAGPAPPIKDLDQAIRGALEECNAKEGTSFQLSAAETSPSFTRFVIQGAGRTGFTVDLVRMGGVAPAETRKALIASPLGPAAVVVPLDTALLAQKLRALLLREHPKPGDLHDVWFLHERGVRLSRRQSAALSDSLAMAEVDRVAAMERIGQFSKRAWVAALERSGVSGLTPAAAKQMVATVRKLVTGVLG